MVDSAEDQDEGQTMKCPCKRLPKLGDLPKGAAGQVMPCEGRQTTRRGERVPSSKLGFKAAASLARATAKAAEGFKEAGNTVDHIVVRHFQNSTMANPNLFEKKRRPVFKLWCRWIRQIRSTILGCGTKEKW